jgi:phosphoribosylanthranilate isomerase
VGVSLRVKICGITSLEDALAAVDAGADAIGLNLVGGPRCLDVLSARSILRSLPPLVTPVLLVRLESGIISGRLSAVLVECRVSHLQLYGDVTAESVRRLLDQGIRAMPVVAVRDRCFAEELAGWGGGGPGCCPPAVVLDAYDPAREGGTGRTFRWDWVAQVRQSGEASRWPRVILAGGLRPDNVAEAVRVVRPYGVDVSSGVEVDAQPGRKDREKLIAFVRNAREALSA